MNKDIKVVSFTLMSFKNKTKEPHINCVPTVTLWITLAHVYCFEITFRGCEFGLFDED